ncbi:MAG: hypothetical protein WEA61_07280 [Anaerolineales bacterium]
MQNMNLRRFFGKLRALGFREGIRRSFLRKTIRGPFLPLGNIDPFFLFNTNLDDAEGEEKKRRKNSGFIFAASSLEQQYPLIFHSGNRFLRYAFMPALNQAKALVVFFHGHGGDLPPSPCEDFDILAPWDTFGYRRLGSWFWGEHGDGFVERMIVDLINETRAEGVDQPWFTYGGSMGGFGALWHGIKYDCTGIYVTSPQIDLVRKIEDYGDVKENAYAFLGGKDRGGLPDLYNLARSKDELPPLFLIQSQYDAVNEFSMHALPLVQTYQEKRAWLGLRVYPGIGHKSHDGSFEEALLFFRLIIEKKVANRVVLQRK